MMAYMYRTNRLILSETGAHSSNMGTLHRDVLHQQQHSELDLNWAKVVSLGLIQHSPPHQSNFI